MKKIMFNDKYGLTQAVLEGRKTMTRRSIPKKLLKSIELYAHGNDEELRHRLFANSPYKIGEVVAIAQAYKDIYNDAYHIGLYGRTAAWTNKMFVKADLMPHHIYIMDIRLERLQEISDMDCTKEGVGHYYCRYGGIMEYKEVPILKIFNSLCEAFAALIDKVSGKGTWDSNPMVWVYEFKLID